MKRVGLKKSIALAIIILFLGVATYPSIGAINIVANSDNEVKLCEIDKILNKESTKNRNFYEAYEYNYNIRYYENKRFIKNFEEEGLQSIDFINLPSNNKHIHKINMNSNTIYVPDDFLNIQDAVDNATPEDTIVVRNGNYNENIIVNKPLVIQSENGYSNCTIKQKTDKKNIITITSDYVSIIGFNIKGLDISKAGISHYNVNHTTIVGNKFSKLYYGIKGQYTNNNTIKNNLIGSMWGLECYGIWLQHANHNLIYNNKINDLEYYAVAIHLKKTCNNIVKNNILGGSYCIGLLSSKYNMICGNVFRSSLWAQMHMNSSYNNNIVNNTFIKTSFSSEGLRILNSGKNKISNNNFTKSGIFIYESYNNQIEYNMVNNKPLVFLEDESNININENAGQIILVNCNNINICNQNITDSIVGIELFKTNNFKISNSTIKSHNYEGLYAIFSNKNKIINCTFSGCSNGIGMYFCNNNEFNSNKISGNDWKSVIIKDSHHNIFIGNEVTKNFYGIRLIKSNYNDLINNEIYKLSYDSAIEIKKSNFNNIKENNIHDHSYGILIYKSSHNNTISGNNININKNCGGLNTSISTSGGKNNIIYHNNIFYAPVYDTSKNQWDSGYPGGGNYYNYYKDVDKDEDGIWDHPYILPGAKSRDRYPFVNPSGWDNNPPSKPKCRYIRKDNEIIVTSSDIDLDMIRYGVSWSNNGEIDFWTDYYNSGEDVHIVCEEIEGEVGVIAEDEKGSQSPWNFVKEKSVNHPRTIDNIIQRLLAYFPIYKNRSICRNLLPLQHFVSLVLYKYIHI
jgi:parallel beta-helix repeat protein